MYMKVSRLVFGIATIGSLSFAGFLILYWQKKKRQQSIEETLKGGNRKPGKKPLSSLPPRARTGAGDAAGSTVDGEITEAEKAKKALQKEALEKTEADGLSRSGDRRRMQERSIDLEMRVSKQDLASLIGKAGSNIRKIQKETNTRITAQGEPLENGDKLYTIRGTPDAVELAESKIKKHITSQPVLNKFEMQVPEDSIGRIIGRGGDTIRSIQDVTLTHIAVDVQPTVDDGKLFTDDDYEAPKRAEGNLRTITIKGTDEQIDHARKQILHLVQENATMRERIFDSTRTRTPRMNANARQTKANGDNSNATLVPIPSDDRSLPLRQDKTMEVFVSCVYHPNEFYFQIVNQDTIFLDELSAKMTEYYKRIPKGTEDTCSYAIGDHVAAPYCNDDKIYRAKVLDLEGDTAEIRYLDYGDKRQIKISDLRKLNSEFLKLRFQAILATLNLECLEERWTDEACLETCELTRCASWQPMKAKVVAYLKESSDDSNSTPIWLEIYNEQNENIADTLIRKGVAGLKDDQTALPIATAPVVLKSLKPTTSSANGISYASIAAGGSIT